MAVNSTPCGVERQEMGWGVAIGNFSPCKKTKWSGWEFRFTAGTEKRVIEKGVCAVIPRSIHQSVFDSQGIDETVGATTMVGLGEGNGK